MTNPNNAIGTNGAFDGRTSPNALNDITAAFTRGIVSGWNCAPKSGMTVQLGGSASVRDVALVEDNAGDKLTINNRSGAPVEVTLAGAPATNNRIDAIVAYVDNPSTGDGNTTDNPTACGIIAVSGTVAANPTAPTDEQIRSAITTDGATGGVAYYVVLATIRVGTSVTSIGSGVITQGTPVQSIAALADGAVSTEKLADGAVTSEKVDWTTMTSTYAHASTNTRVQYPTSFGNFLTVTVPKTGTYRIESIAHAATNELAQNWYARTRITVNGSVPSTFDPYAESFIAGNSDYYACATISNNGVVSLTQGDVVALQLQSGTNNSKCLLNYADLFIQRIS